MVLNSGPQTQQRIKKQSPIQCVSKIKKQNLLGAVSLVAVIFLSETLLAQISLNTLSQVETQSLGGVSGGGGRVIDPKEPVYPQDPKKVEKHIRCVKHPIFHYLEFKKALLDQKKLDSDQTQVFSQLLSKKPNIFDAFHEVDLRIEDNDSCYDQNKNLVDGSYIPQVQDHVCISAANIAKKVDFSEVKSQSAALIIHEYSEVLGNEEDFALKAQTVTLADFKKWELQNSKIDALNPYADDHCDDGHDGSHEDHGSYSGDRNDHGKGNH